MEQKDQIQNTREGWIRTYEQLSSISKAARRCGIARSTLQRWIKRLPVVGLADRSKRPHKLTRQRLDDETENLILEIRDTYRFGKIRICSHLLQHYQLRLSPSTVARVLKMHNKRRLKIILMELAVGIFTFFGQQAQLICMQVVFKLSEDQVEKEL